MLICIITVFTTLAPTTFAAGKTISGTSAKEVTLTVVTGNKETGSWLLGNSFSDDDYKIKLSPNSTYKITIRPVTDWYFAQFSIANFWIYKDWKKDASWTISKQLGIKSITVNK